MFSHIAAQDMQMKPATLTVLGGVNIIAQMQVWMDNLKGWAALITVLIGVPTGILIFIYWALKVQQAFKDKKNATQIP